MVLVWITFNDLFKVTIIQRQITWKWYNIELYLQWPTDRKSYILWSIKQRHFQWPWTISTPCFKVTPFFHAEYLRNTTYRHSFNEILIGTYTRPTQQCHFKWPWVNLSDLAKYSVTRSVARSLCDSWASCLTAYCWRELIAMSIFVEIRKMYNHNIDDQKLSLRMLTVQWSILYIM